MLDIENSSVMDVIENAKEALNKVGIKRYSESKMNMISETLSKYAQEIGASDQLCKILSVDIPNVIETGKSISVDRIAELLSQEQDFLGITVESVKRQIDRESENFYADDNYDNLSRYGADPNFFIKREYAKKLCPDMTDEEYDAISKAWRQGKLDPSSVVYNVNYSSVSKMAIPKIEEVLSNKRKASEVRNILYGTKLNWNDLVANDESEEEPSSILEAVLNLDYPLIDATYELSHYFATYRYQDELILKNVRDMIKNIDNDNE